MYYETKKEMGMALKLFVECAEAGSIWGMVSAARIYSDHRLSYHDDTRAFRWWMEAILQHDPLRPTHLAIKSAHVGLAQFYKEGRGMCRPIPSLSWCHTRLSVGLEE